MTVFVLGLGYIGLPTALLLAKENDVVGVDIDPDRVRSINNGKLPFEESGLVELFNSVDDRFTARTTLPTPDEDPGSRGHSDTNTYMIATPTPLDEVTEVPNLEYVRSALETISQVLLPGDIVVLESTVPPGTTDRLAVPILEESSAGDDGFRFAYCPERALPGNTIKEMINNDRIIGGIDQESTTLARELYGFVEGTIYSTDAITTEFIKLIENTYRDTNIALANELAKLAEQFGIDGRRAIDLANKHPRVDILSPGPGVGGHCLPIDPQFLIQISENPRIISLAREINDTMPVHVLRLLRRLVNGRPNTEITVLGVAYKSGVDDTRGTPARRFIRLAENEGYNVRVHDPHVTTFDYPLEDFDNAVEGSDCLVIITDHRAYYNLDPEYLANLMSEPRILDTRGVIDADDWESVGFTVMAIGDGSRTIRTNNPS